MRPPLQRCLTARRAQQLPPVQGALIAGLLLAILGAGCSPEEGSPSRLSGPPRWSVERLQAIAADAEEVRVSRENVSRPLWLENRQSGVALRSEGGGRLLYEIAAEQGQKVPESVSVQFRVSGDSHVLAARPQRSAPSASPRPWHAFEVDLDMAPAGTGTVTIQVAGQPIDSASGWLVSTPRLYRARDEGSRPNILLITLDTVRADLLGCYGHSRPTSPEIDVLAAKSTRFDRAISQAPWTLPSYSSMFSSLSAEEHGVVHRNHRFPDQLLSFVELLAAGGYTTAGFVSGTFTDADWGFDQGFDSYDDLGMVTDDDGERAGSSSVEEVKKRMDRAARRVTSEEITDKACAWLEQNREHRFFLLAHYFDPHADYLEHAGFSERFAPEPIVKRLDLSGTPIPADTARQKALHEGELAFTDHHIGRLLDRLRELDLERETVVVLCADHGEEFFERGRQGHGHALFDELVRVPLLLQVPGMAVPGVVTEPVANLDIGPTLLDLAGLPPLPSARGRSLLPLLQPSNERTPVAVFSSRHPPSPPPAPQRKPPDWFRVDLGELTYLELSKPRRFRFLFDSVADPLHTRNLARSRPEDADRLASLYHEALAKVSPRAGAPEEIQLSEDVRQRLAELGYLDDEE